MNSPWFETRDRCPICLSDTSTVLYQSQYDQSPVRDYLEAFYSQQGTIEFEYLAGAAYILCECNQCRAIFQRDIPGAALMERLYGHWIDPKETFSRRQKSDNLEYYSNYAQEIMQIISYFGKAPSSLCFLDYGMGWGKWALLAKAFGTHSFGTDLSIERTENAKLNGIDVITWDEIPNHKFDLINTEQVFEHLPHPLQTLRYLKTALKPNGILKISVPTANDISRRLKVMDWKCPKGSRNSLNAVAPLEHINYFRRSSLLEMAKKADMEEVFIPIALQYRYTTNWGLARRFAKKALTPIYRNWLKRVNYIFLRNNS